MLFPVGTVYDPFVCRGLDALIHGLYSGARFVFAGTPSGITLASEGGAHQSTVTPDLGIALPHLRMYEPCFARELEWILLEALRQCCDRVDGCSTYLRLSTREIEQSLIQPALDRLGAEELRRHVLAGGYRLLDGQECCPNAGHQDSVILAATGAVLPEVIAAAQLLHYEGVAATVLSLTSPDRLFAGWRMSPMADNHHLSILIPPAERDLPIITVTDGTSHALAWLGSVYGAPVIPLGVDAFGQSGSRADLYHHFGLDVDQIADVAFRAIDSRMPG
jgi:pyruvate dehydrogenase E1 component